MNNHPAFSSIVSRAVTCVVLGALALTSLSSCDSDLWELKDKSEGSYKSSNGHPISTTLDESGDFIEWVRVLNYSGTYGILNALYDGQSLAHKFTLFAPTDSALYRFYASKGVASIEELGIDYAQALVRTMTYDGDSLKLSEKFGSTLNRLSYQSEAGELFDLSVNPSRVGYLLNDSIPISQRYLSCSNGFVYTTEGVVSPLVESVYRRIVADGKSTIMTEALIATGFDCVLDRVADTTYVLGRRVISPRHFTFLNVRDADFMADGIQSLADLKTELTRLAVDASVGPDSLLRQYVRYHLMDASYTLADLHKMLRTDSVRIWSTQAPNQILMISRHLLAITGSGNENGVGVADTAYYYSLNDGNTAYERHPILFVDQIGGRSREVRVTSFRDEISDLRAKNGYIHNLTDWMPVYEPKPTTVVWDLADYSEVRNALGDLFQPQVPVSSESKIDLSRLDCYTVEVGPNGVSNNSYSNLCYVTCKSNLKDCLYNDRVVFNVGYQGSVSFSTPTLVKGRYRVSISMAYLTELSFIRTSNGCKGGMLRLTVDDAHPLLTAPYTTITRSLAGVYETVLYDEISFDETASHVFRFVVMDPAASTNSKFSLQFDAITFTPIE